VKEPTITLFVRKESQKQSFVLRASLRASNTLQANESVMFEIPDPLHPAVVHFPIGLMFLGTLFSILTIFTRRGALPQFAALILILAAAGAQLAVITGGEETDDVVQRMPESRPLIYRHAEWGELMRNVAVAAACSAVVAVAFFKAQTFRQVMAFVTTIIAASACYCAFEALQSGAEMVYHHGVGVEKVAPKPSNPAPPSTPASGT
jgi:uncharacterized membrane protein